MRLLALLAVLLTAAASPAQETEAELPPVPETTRELRGVWVATVENIDWPTEPGLPVERQKQEAVAILDRSRDVGLNVVILQVRPAADALYDSPIEPWSYYLTGEQGKAPEPYYDPLTFWVEEAHKRGLELHVWLNPYRVRPATDKYQPGPESIAQTNPDAVLAYGNESRKQLWMDPANEEAQQQTLAVFDDLVKRYDLDGVHMDDYFYPYPVADLPFPDDASYDRYRKAGGDLELNDFRRENVNELVEQIWKQTKAAKPHVKVGLSPFGIWRPGNPASVQGFDQYDKLYADAKLWLNEGWVDYYTPQLYWSIASPQQSYPALLSWWAGENTKDRILAPGLYTGRLYNNSKNWSTDEVAGQIYITRYTGLGEGNVHFSMKSITQNVKGIADRMRDEIYAEPALVPAMPWVEDEAPEAPKVEVERVAQVPAGPEDAALPGHKFFEPLSQPATRPAAAGGVRVTLQTAQPAKVYVVHALRDGAWDTVIVPGGEGSVVLPEYADRPIRAVAAAAVDRFGNESEPKITQMPATTN